MIWHLNSNRWNSAITEYALSLVHALNHNGYETIAFGKTGKPFLRRLEKESELKCFGIQKFSLMALPYFYSKSKNLTPSTIVTYGGPEMNLMLLMRLLGLLKGVSIIRFYGSANTKPFSPLSKLLKTWLPLLRVQMLFPSQVQKDRLMGEEKSPSLVLPLGMNIKSPKISKDQRAEAEPVRLMIFGRLDPVKGHREFLKIYQHVFRYFANADRKCVLTVVGLEENLKVEDVNFAVENLNLPKEALEFVTERVNHVEDLLSSATVGVISSLGSEIICRVGIEFLCCGVPIFVSGVGSLNELLVDSSFGISYAKLDAKSAAKVLIEWIEQDAEDQRSLRSEKARQVFGLERMCQTFEDHFLA